jgi:hypothetical protein
VAVAVAVADGDRSGHGQEDDHADVYDDHRSLRLEARLDRGKACSSEMVRLSAPPSAGLEE